MSFAGYPACAPPQGVGFFGRCRSICCLWGQRERLLHGPALQRPQIPHLAVATKGRWAGKLHPGNMGAGIVSWNRIQGLADLDEVAAVDLRFLEKGHVVIRLDR